MDIIVNNTIDFVCEKYKIKRTDLFSKSRKQNIVYARVHAFIILRDKHLFTLKDIGCIFYLTHSNVYTLINNHKDKFTDLDLMVNPKRKRYAKRRPKAIEPVKDVAQSEFIKLLNIEKSRLENSLNAINIVLGIYTKSN